MVRSAATSSVSPLSAGKKIFTIIGGSVGAYKGCVGGLNGFSSVSRSFTIDRTRPTILTKKPIATAPPIPRMMSAILIRLGISVRRRLWRFGKPLDSIGNCAGQASLKRIVHERLGSHCVVQIADFQQQ